MNSKLLKLTVAALVILAGLALLSACSDVKPGRRVVEFPDSAAPEFTDENIRMDVTVDGEPEVIYAPLKGGVGYRYGPVFMYYPDGSCDAWFATTGANGDWDWLTVRHAEKDFQFGEEKVCLVPTPNSMDKYSCCDPGIVYFNGYYYLGYTSTITETNGGCNNNVFVARSRNPEGPYEKWDGEGWGGDPEPIIYYDEEFLFYGAGEPSFVILGDTLYIYYTWICGHGSFLGVATADLSENWPATVKVHEDKLMRKQSDSFDVIYVEETGRFLAFATEHRITRNSGIVVYESTNGLDFTRNELLRGGLYAYCHNMGIARRPDGHVRLTDNIVVGYAFSDGGPDNWGKWATAIQPVKLSISDAESMKIDDEKTLSTVREDCFSEPLQNPTAINFCALPRYIEAYNFSEYTDLAFCWYDRNLAPYPVTDVKNVKAVDYDKSLVSFKGNRMYILGKVGETRVTFKYKGFSDTIVVAIRDNETDIDNPYRREVKSAELVNDEFIIPLSCVHRRQIRYHVIFTDNSWCETYGEPAIVKKFPVTYVSQNEAVAYCDENGFIIPQSVGETYIEAIIAGITRRVRVVIVE